MSLWYQHSGLVYQFSHGNCFFREMREGMRCAHQVIVFGYSIRKEEKKLDYATENSRENGLGNGNGFIPFQVLETGINDWVESGELDCFLVGMSNQKSVTSEKQAKNRETVRVTTERS